MLFIRRQRHFVFCNYFHSFFSKDQKKNKNRNCYRVTQCMQALQFEIKVLTLFISKLTSTFSTTCFPNEHTFVEQLIVICFPLSYLQTELNICSYVCDSQTQ